MLPSRCSVTGFAGKPRQSSRSAPSPPSRHPHPTAGRGRGCGWVKPGGEATQEAGEESHVTERRGVSSRAAASQGRGCCRASPSWSRALFLLPPRPAGVRVHPSLPSRSSRPRPASGPGSLHPKAPSQILPSPLPQISGQRPCLVGSLLSIPPSCTFFSLDPSPVPLSPSAGSLRPSGPGMSPAVPRPWS